MIEITNFRDIGGLKNREGKIIRKKTFLRSGELTNVSKAEKQLLEDVYHLNKVIDMRSEAEVKQRPDTMIPNTEYIHIDIIEDIQDEGASMDDFIKIGSPEKSMDYMKKLYEDIALDATAQKGYAHFFEEILSLEKDDSILFHCFAGKDRTGIAALLILEALETPKAAIYHDYLLTNQLRTKENARIIEQARSTGLTEDNLAALKIALNVDSSYLDIFYQTIEKKYGDIQTYLKKAIQLNNDMLVMIQHRFLRD